MACSRSYEPRVALTPTFGDGYDQYTQPDGGSTEDVATVRETKINARKIV